MSCGLKVNTESLWGVVVDTCIKRIVAGSRSLKWDAKII